MAGWRLALERMRYGRAGWVARSDATLGRTQGPDLGALGARAGDGRGTAGVCNDAAGPGDASDGGGVDSRRERVRGQDDAFETRDLERDGDRFCL